MGRTVVFEEILAQHWVFFTVSDHPRSDRTSSAAIEHCFLTSHNRLITLEKWEYNSGGTIKYHNLNAIIKESVFARGYYISLCDLYGQIEKRFRPFKQWMETSGWLSTCCDKTLDHCVIICFSMGITISGLCCYWKGIRTRLSKKLIKDFDSGGNLLRYNCILTFLFRSVNAISRLYYLLIVQNNRCRSQICSYQIDFKYFFKFLSIWINK